MKKQSRRYFQEMFDGLTARAKAVIALRTAMRSLPVLAYRSGGDAKPFSYWNAADRESYALAIFQCLEISLFVCSSPKGNSAACTAAAARAKRAYVAAAAGAAAMVRAGVAAAAAAGTRAAAAAASRNASAASDEAADAAAAATRAIATLARIDGAATLADIDRVRHSKRFWPRRVFDPEIPEPDMIALLTSPLWPEAEPEGIFTLRTQLESDLRALDAGFDIWIDWYRDRLEGNAPDWEVERQSTLLTKEQLAQPPAEINAYLKELREGTLTKGLKRVRAIFIGNGGAGKTSLVRALHGEEVKKKESMTKGVAIIDSMEEQAGVFTRVTKYSEDGPIVHFWDFGGQVIAHATHQFFLRSKCLYVIVLAERSGNNPNEEVEYWLEHVRAFGDSAPVILVGNKADVMPVTIDLYSLKQKYPNIINFYSVSCARAKSDFQGRFEAFREEFRSRVNALAKQAELFTPAQFSVLRNIETKSRREDLLPAKDFDQICRANGIPMEGPGGRDGLLDLFDKLGIVTHFSQLPFLTDYVLNPRWLTFGVYSIMYSEEAIASKGRLTEAEFITILKKVNPSIPNGSPLRFPAEKIRIIADAMIAFRLAYRLSRSELVIPALLAPEQPRHDFDDNGAIAFRFDFGGFLPRHVLPALIVEYFRDIARQDGSEVVWQNGVLLRPRRYRAEALVRADYHTRMLNLQLKGADATLYLGVLRHSIQSTLENMPDLTVREEVALRPEMLVDATAPTRPEREVWMTYDIIQTARENRLNLIPGPGSMYDMSRIVATMPVSPDVSEEVFLSYSNKDGAAVEALFSELQGKRISVWYDDGLIVGQPYRNQLRRRIETAKVVVVLWTENSIDSRWVCAEADLAEHHGKLICLKDPNLDPKHVPLPFGEHQMIELGNIQKLLEALALKDAKPKA